MSGQDRSTLRDLRRTRRDRRLGSTEWFDVAYRVYLFALGGTALVIWASDFLDGAVDDVGRADLLAVGPGVAGVAAAIAVAVGLRHGAEGGPVAVEPGDVRHLLGSPISRRSVLQRPIVQRMRSVAFALGVILAVLGQLVGREIVGSRAAWAGAGLLFGGALGALYVSVAVLAHAVHLPRGAASGAGALLLAAQLGSALATWRAVDRGDGVDGVDGVEALGPFDLVGSLALWGVRQRAIDVVALAVIVALTAGATVVGDRLRIEALERRGRLVSQLRFAATMQDIRTVVQLRRQLSAEAPRQRPWLGAGSSSALVPTAGTGTERPVSRPVVDARSRAGLDLGVVVRRGVSSFARFPISRLVRLAAFAIAAGVFAHGALAWTPIAHVGLVVTLYLAGLDLLEPLAQEIDRPDRTDGLPVDRSTLFVAHLIVPSIAAVPFAAAGAIVVAALEPDRLAAAFGLALPVAWGGMIGAVATTVGDATRPATVQNTTVLGADRLAESPFSLPEFAGVSAIGAGVLPLVASAVAVVPIVAADVTGTAGGAVRGVVAVALCLSVLVWWVRRRDRWAVGIRSFFAEGRAATTGSST